MRVIAGACKGRRLEAPTWEGLRPTSDRLRETLFNIVAARVPGARVLDGYAGTGAIGIEAMSRGAASAVFVERDRRASALIARNLARCGLAEGCAIIRAGFTDTALAEDGFELIVLDPPYDDADLGAPLAAAARLVTAGGLVVVEHAWRREPPPAPAGLARTRTVRAGDSALSFYERRSEGA